MSLFTLHELVSTEARARNFPKSRRLIRSTPSSCDQCHGYGIVTINLSRRKSLKADHDKLRCFKKLLARYLSLESHRK